MTHTTIAATEESLNDYLAAANVPILLDLWAPWCAPCRALAPTLEKLAEEAGESLIVLKIDVDEHPGVRERFGVRGIPTMILLKGDAELDRLSGTQPLSKLKQWLGQNGAPVQSNVAQPNQVAQRWGAFYGDAQLREFLIARMKQHADQGDVSSARAPVWTEGKGTFAATFVHSESLDVFERISGLPSSLAPALDFVGACNEKEVSALLDVMRLDADLNLVAGQLLQSWLSDSEHQWAEVLNEPELDAVRLQWLALFERSMTHHAPSAAEWEELRQAAAALENPSQDPYRQLQGMLANLLTQVAPLPTGNNGLAWSAVFGTAGWCNLHLLMAALGWTTTERATPGLRNDWFKSHERELGGFSKEQLHAHRERWSAENADFLIKEQAFHAQYAERMKAPNSRRAEVLAQLVAKAPLYLPA